MADGPEQRPAYEEPLAVQLVLDRRRVLAAGQQPAASAARRCSSWRAVVPLVHRLADVDALVALQAQQLAARPPGQHLGHLGLADAGLALEQQRSPQPQGEEDGGGQALVGQVLVRGERSLECGDRLRIRRRSTGRFLQGPADEHLGEVGAELDRGVDVGLRLGADRGLLRPRRPRTRPMPVPSSTAVARSGVEPMLTRPIPVVPLRTAATPTMAQSWARRLNFWNDQPAPATFGTRISVSSSSALERRLEEPGEEVGGGDDRARHGPRARDQVPPSASSTAGRSEAGIGVGDRAADGAPMADLGVADLAGGGRQDRHLRRKRSDVSTSRWRVSAPMAMWSPASRMPRRSAMRPTSMSIAGWASRSFISGSSE